MLPTAVTALIVLRWRLADVGAGDIRLVQQSIAQAIFSAGGVFLLMLTLTALAWAAGRRTRAGPGVDSEAGRA